MPHVLPPPCPRPWYQAVEDFDGSARTVVRGCGHCYTCREQWARRVRARAIAGVQSRGSATWRFATWTFDRDLCIRSAIDCWRVFQRRACKPKFGKVDYFRCYETTARGRLHVHAIVNVQRYAGPWFPDTPAPYKRGETLAHWRSRISPESVTIADRLQEIGFGPLFEVAPVLAKYGAAAYLAGYLGKGEPIRLEDGRSLRLYGTSRGWAPNVSGLAPMAAAVSPVQRHVPDEWPANGVLGPLSIQGQRERDARAQNFWLSAYDEIALRDWAGLDRAVASIVDAQTPRYHNDACACGCGVVVRRLRADVMEELRIVRDLLLEDIGWPGTIAALDWARKERRHGVAIP